MNTKQTGRGRRRPGNACSGLTLTAMAFGTMLSVAIIAVGCGDNIGGSSRSDTASQSTPQRDSQLQVVPARTTTDTSTSEGDPASEPAITREVSYAEAEEAYTERRYDEAANLFEAYTRTNGSDSWGHYMLGLSEWKSGDRNAAETAFREALEIDRGHAKSWVNLARVLIELDRSDEALTAVDEAVAVDPDSNPAFRTKGRALDELGRGDEAEEAYMTALRFDEEDAWAMNNLGLVHIRAERFGDALPPLARAVELRDDVAVFYNNLGITLERLGDYASAIEAYSSAVAIDSSHAAAAANLARVESLEPDSTVEPFDLGQMAVQFADEIGALQADQAPVEAGEANEEVTSENENDEVPENS